MKSILLYCCTLLCCCLVSACHSTDNNEFIPPSSQARFVGNTPSSANESFKVKAKFVDFEVGDVEHYLFEDEQGEIWDFTNCSDEDFVFKQSLAIEQHDDFNQGWTSNKLLQGRWFLLECGTRQQPLYPDGPSDIAQVIEEATLLY